MTRGLFLSMIAGRVGGPPPRGRQAATPRPEKPRRETSGRRPSRDERRGEDDRGEAGGAPARRRRDRPL